MTKGIGMELRDYIAMGEEAAGGTAKLALQLGVVRNSVTNAKAHQRGLPLPACFKLADLIGVPRDTVAAASALATEKDEAIRAYLRPFAQNLGRAAALVMTIAGIVSFSLTTENAKAATSAAYSDTSKVTSSSYSNLPDENEEKGEFVLCKIATQQNHTFYAPSFISLKL